MKKQTQILLLLVTLFTSNACKDKLDKSCDANFLEADVNGLLWQAMDVTGFKSVGTGGHITISAKANYGAIRQVVIQTPNDVSTGAYTLDPAVFVQSLVIYPGGYSADAGTLTITVHDTNAGIIKGTFDFVGLADGLDVKEGSFCVKY